MGLWSKVKDRLGKQKRDAQESVPTPSAKWGEVRFGGHTVTPPQGWVWRESANGDGIVFAFVDGESAEGDEPVIVLQPLDAVAQAEMLENLWQATAPENRISRSSAELPQGATVETISYRLEDDDSLSISYSVVQYPGAVGALVAMPFQPTQQQRMEASRQAVLETLLLDDRFELPKEGTIRLGPVERIKVSRWLEESRREHFQALLMTCRQIRSDPRRTIEVEGLVAELPTQRADVIRIQDGMGEPLTVQIGGRDAREAPCRFTLPSGVAVDIVSPFDWSRVAVRVEGGTADWQAFRAWNDRWLEGAGPVRVSHELVLGGFLHSVSDPLQVAGDPWIEIDFGSAPVEAFWELVEVFAAWGARCLVFSSALPAEEPKACEPFSLSAFVDEAEELLRELHSGVEIERRGELDLLLTLPDQKMSLDLTRAFEEQTGCPWDRQGILGRACAAVGYSLEAESAPAVVVPLVRHQTFFAGRLDGEALFRQELWAGLVLVYARDLPTSLSYLSERRLAELGVDLESVREIAVENLARILPRVVPMDLGDGAYGLVAGGNFEASLLFLPHFWPAGLEGDVVAAVPARDTILLTSAGSEKGVEKVRTKARATFERGELSLSPELLLWRNGSWSLFDEA